MRGIRALAIVCFCGAIALGAAARAETPVDLELVLAVDASASIDADEARLQRIGYVAALTDPRVIAAIQSGMLGRIAVVYVEWGDGDQQRIVGGWHLVSDAASARALAGEIAAAGRESWVDTSIGGAIDFAVPLFDGNGFEGARRIIDISGDGRNSSNGPRLDEARAAALSRGITINGLPIVDGFAVPGALDRYYADKVIGGPGAFRIAAHGFEDFASAILDKLVLEIAGLTPR
jgi:hypothetical protein